MYFVDVAAATRNVVAGLDVALQVAAVTVAGIFYLYLQSLFVSFGN